MKKIFADGEKVMNEEGMIFLLQGLMEQVLLGKIIIEVKEHEHIEGEKEVSLIEITQNLKE